MKIQFAISVTNSYDFLIAEQIVQITICTMEVLDLELLVTTRTFLSFIPDIPFKIRIDVSCSS